MTYPRQAIEACEALSHPLPHPTMPIDYKPSTDDLITAALYQADGGAKVNTQHPGPIEMLDEPDEAPVIPAKAARIDGYLVVALLCVIAVLGLAHKAAPLIETHLPALMGATAK